MHPDLRILTDGQHEEHPPVSITCNCRGHAEITGHPDQLSESGERHSTEPHC